MPLGRRVELAGRGTTFVREVAGPTDAPTLLLLHGYMASAGLNWFRAFDALGEDFRVIAPDARGHARGLRSRRHVRLADCADDMAALIDELDTGPVIAVGYSMGGPIAQLLWKRHPEKVAGLVLCATAPELGFGVRALNDAYLATRRRPRPAPRANSPRCPAAGANVLRRVRAHRPAGFLEWAADEMRRHDVRMLTEAARSISRFDSRAVDPRRRRADHGVPHEPRPARGPGEPDRARHARSAARKVVDHDHGHFACAPHDVHRAARRRLPRRRLARQRLTRRQVPIRETLGERPGRRSTARRSRRAASHAGDHEPVQPADRRRARSPRPCVRLHSPRRGPVPLADPGTYGRVRFRWSRVRSRCRKDRGIRRSPRRTRRTRRGGS